MANAAQGASSDLFDYRLRLTPDKGRLETMAGAVGAVIGTAPRGEDRSVGTRRQVVRRRRPRTGIGQPVGVGIAADGLVGQT